MRLKWDFMRKKVETLWGKSHNFKRKKLKLKYCESKIEILTRKKPNLWILPSACPLVAQRWTANTNRKQATRPWKEFFNFGDPNKTSHDPHVGPDPVFGNDWSKQFEVRVCVCVCVCVCFSFQPSLKRNLGCSLRLTFITSSLSLCPHICL